MRVRQPCTEYTHLFGTIRLVGAAIAPVSKNWLLRVLGTFFMSRLTVRTLTAPTKRRIHILTESPDGSVCQELFLDWLE